MTSDVSETTCRRNERSSNQPHSFNSFSSSGYSLVSCFVFNPNLVPRVLSYTFLQTERERRVGERTRERGWFNPSNSHLRRRRSGQSIFAENSSRRKLSCTSQRGTARWQVNSVVQEDHESSTIDAGHRLCPMRNEHSIESWNWFA